MVTGGQVQNLTSMLLLAIGLGLVGGFVLMLLDILFVPYWPKPILELALSASLWENFTASFYGSINEELLTRLFGVSVTAWLLGRIWHTTAGVPTSAVFWAAIALLAVLFAVGHLPTLKGLVNEVSPTMLSRTIILNTPIGLTCGWLFWRYGIEAAMLTHFTADIVYHVGGTIVIQRIKLPKLAV